MGIYLLCTKLRISMTAYACYCRVVTKIRSWMPDRLVTATIAMTRPACFICFISDKTGIGCIAIQTGMYTFFESIDIDFNGCNPISGMATDTIRTVHARHDGTCMEIFRFLSNCYTAVKWQVLYQCVCLRYRCVFIQCFLIPCNKPHVT